MKLFKAVRGLYVSHIFGSLAAILLLIPLWSVISGSALAYFLITAGVHICLIYSTSWRCGDRDGRKIPGFYPSYRFAGMVAGWGLVIPVLLLALRFVFPNLWMTDVPIMNGGLAFLSTDIYFQGTTDLMYKLWYFPYLFFMGNGSFFRYLIPILIQTLTVFLGYYVGTKRIRVLDHVMQKMIYQEKKEN